MLPGPRGGLFCAQQCKRRTTPSPLRSRLSPGPGAGSLLAKRGACARARVPLLDARSRFRLRLPALSRSPKCGPRAQLSWARPLPDAHVRVQLSSMFPPLRGRSLLQRGVGLGRGRGQCPAGPHPHPQRLPSPVLTQALSSPLINRPGTAPLMVSLATFPQVSLPSPPKPSSSKAL